MQTTFEIRWFTKGTPPAAVQHWFESECPKEMLTPKAETREDLYACGDLENNLSKFKKFVPNFAGDWAQPTLRDRINLKLREGNLELKLRREQFGIKTFTHHYGDRIWSGKVEQWRKFDLQQLEKAPSNFDLNSLNWIPVYKRRWQKSDRGVESELTQLETRGSAWWTIAFEMATDNNAGVNFFCEIVEQAAKTYSGPKLLVKDSCGYADWLDRSIDGQ